MTTQNLRIPITNVGSRSLVLEQQYEQYMLQHQTASATFCNTKQPQHLFLTNLANPLHFLFCIQQLPFLTKLSLQVMLQQFNFFLNSSKPMMITQSNKCSILVCKSISANEFFRRNKTFTIPDDLNHPLLITFFFIHDAFFFLKHHKASIIPEKN